MRGSRFFLATAFAVFLVLLWAVRDACPVMDDFVLFALGHLLHDPLPLATQDAVGSFFYRPLGLVAWWITVQAFGTGAFAQYAFTLAVHAFNGVLVAAVLRRLGASALAAAIAGLFFIAHPAACSAILWLCDRFDLLSTTFGLAALWATASYVVDGRRAAFVAAIVATAASLLSKEVGVAYAAGAFMLAVLGAASAEATGRRSRYALAFAVALTTFAFIAIRHLIVRGASEGLLFEHGFFATIFGGSFKWLGLYPRFLVAAKGSAVAIAGWIAALVAIAVGFALAVRRAPMPRPLIHGAIAGVAVAAIAAGAQSPVVNAILFEPLRLARFDFVAQATARFYYTPLAATMLILGALLDVALRAPRRRIVLAACVAGLAGLMWGSVAVGRAWSAYTVESSDRFAVAARRAVASMPVKPGCHLYFLGTPPEAEPFRQFSHMAVLYPLPASHPLWRCMVLTEHAPWYNLLVVDPPSGGATDARASPALVGITIGGKPFPPLRVGPLEYRYLKVASDAAVRSDPDARFFAWDGQRFVDADARVRAGEFRFFDNRPPA